MPKRLSPAEKLRRERERIAKQKARLEARLQKQQEQKTVKALRPINRLLGRAAARFEHFCPDDNPFWEKDTLMRTFGIPSPKTFIADYERECVLEAKRIQKAERRKIRLENRIWRIYQAMTSWYVADMDQDMIRDSARDLGQLIYEVEPVCYIGWTSQKALEARASAKRSGIPFAFTEEHLYPRQLAGEILMYHLIVTDGELSLGTCRRYIDVFRQVARVTGGENIALAPFQKREVFITPELAYQQAGIEVVYDNNRTKFQRLEHVAPIEVLREIFGERVDEFHKYSC